jgi:hypothetical protein
LQLRLTPEPLAPLWQQAAVVMVAALAQVYGNLAAHAAFEDRAPGAAAAQEGA